MDNKYDVVWEGPVDLYGDPIGRGRVINVEGIGVIAELMPTGKTEWVEPSDWHRTDGTDIVANILAAALEALLEKKID